MERQLLTHVVSLSNRSHNEILQSQGPQGITAMASAAAELDLSKPLDLDSEAVYFFRESTLVSWESRRRDHLTPVAARQGVALIGKEMKRKGGSVTQAHAPWSAACQCVAALSGSGSEHAGGGALINENFGKQEEDIIVFS